MIVFTDLNLQELLIRVSDMFTSGGFSLAQGVACRALAVGLSFAVACSAQSLSIMELRVNSRLEVSDPAGAACVVKLLDRDTQGLSVSVAKNSVACGPRGRRFRIEAGSIQRLSSYRESRTARALSGLKAAGASAGVILAGVAVGFGTESGAAGLAIIAGGLSAITVHSIRREIRYGVRVDKIP